MVFYCRNDHAHYAWRSEDYQESDEGIFAVCPICGSSAKQVRASYLGLVRAWNTCPGGNSPRRDYSRSRLNNWKTGEYCKTYHLLAPAMAGRFPICEGCELRDPCENKELRFCPIQIEPMIRFAEAYQEGKIETMKEFAGISQAKIFSIIQMMFMEIQEKGLLQPKEVRTTWSRDGREQTKVVEWQQNPLLNRLPHYIELLGFSADQMIMTPKVQQEEENFQGYLEVEEEKREELRAMEEKRLKAIEGLKEQLRKAAFARAGDRALQEYHKEVGIESDPDTDSESS